MLEEKEKLFIENAINSIIEELKLELVEINFKESNNTVIIVVLADRPKSGITVDECSIINKQIIAFIEEAGLFNDDFMVEVSSPGLDRSLQTSKDFMRAEGKKVVFYLNDFIEGKKEHSGEVLRTEKNNIIINVKNKEMLIPLCKINKAVQVL